MTGWLWLLAAIGSEVIGSIGLRASEGFRRLGPSLLVVLGYASAFYCFSRALRTVPLSVAYAVWAGLGTALVAVAGAVLFGESIGGWRLVGIGLIVAGVVVLNATGVHR